jgi:hypothetical protein
MLVMQKDPKETEEEPSHFISFMRQKVLGVDPDDIIHKHMDQTPFPCSFPFNQTLERKG